MEKMFFIDITGFSLFTRINLSFLLHCISYLHFYLSIFMFTHTKNGCTSLCGLENIVNFVDL